MLTQNIFREARIGFALYSRCDRLRLWNGTMSHNDFGLGVLGDDDADKQQRPAYLVPGVSHLTSIPPPYPPLVNNKSCQPA